MNKKQSFCLMYIGFLIYSLSGIFSKIASFKEFFSFDYIICFFGIIIVLGIYALLWQQVLKNIPLSVAMANKPFVLILSIIWSILIFHENLKLKTLIRMKVIIIII